MSAIIKAQGSRSDTLKLYTSSLWAGGSATLKLAKA
jgi:hypothetical protein